MKKIFVILCVILFVIYFIKSYLLLDPDFGWHIRMGQYMLSHGIPKTDPFSYTMPSYPFIDHEWLGELLLVWLYPLIGNIGLSMLFSSMALGSLVIPIIALPKQERKFSLILLLLSGIALIFFLGMRLQVISWLFFSLVVWIIFEKKRYIRWRCMLPVLFLLWANIHGGFAYGLGLVGLFFVGKTIQTRKIDITDFFVLVFSVLITCINPYGFRLWSVLWIHASSTLNHWAIQEWLPPIFFTSTFALWFFFALSIMIMFLYRKKFSLTEIMLYLVLLLLSITSMRNVPFWLIYALPLTTRAIYLFYKDIRSNEFSKRAFYKLTFIFLGIACVIGITEVSYDFLQAAAISEPRFYPIQAVAYLQKHPSRGQLFSVYEWGGYLDWKLPSKKVFIDGRMPTWDFNAPKSEEKNAFATYINFLHGKVTFATLEKKYDIHTVLMPSEKVSKYTLVTQLNDLLGKWFHQKNTEVDINKEFRGAGMKVVYQDSVAVIWKMGK